MIDHNKIIMIFFHIILKCYSNMEKVDFIVWVIDIIRTRIMIDKLVIKHILNMPSNLDRVINFKTRCSLTTSLLYFLCNGIEEDIIDQETYYFNEPGTQVKIIETMHYYEEKNKNYATLVYTKNHVYSILRIDDQLVRYESSLGDFRYEITPDYYNNIFDDKEIEYVRLFEIPSMEKIVENVDTLYQETLKFIEKHPKYHDLYEILNSSKW